MEANKDHQSSSVSQDSIGDQNIDGRGDSPKGEAAEKATSAWRPPLERKKRLLSLEDPLQLTGSATHE